MVKKEYANFKRDELFEKLKTSIELFKINKASKKFRGLGNAAENSEQGN